MCSIYANIYNVHLVLCNKLFRYYLLEKVQILRCKMVFEIGSVGELKSELGDLIRMERVRVSGSKL